MQKPRLLILPVLFLFSYSFTKAQTPISGIINTYHKVTSVVAARSCVVVDNPGALAPGDRVMLVQMKGAGVKTTTSGFGDTTSLNKAGNYELNTVCMVKGDSVFLVYSIVQQYTVADKVQLVYVPVYDNAIVVDSLKAAPWNNSTGKGGVLALSVTYSLFLSAPVSATGAGFKGGQAELSSGTCSDWMPASAPFYDASSLSPQNGAYKGESVWEPTNASYTGGKGAVANGGGGGNNHNNGGGGGANLSDGGNGGGNSSSTGCTAANPGEGGSGLNSYGRTKVFLGGGGGAGHVNTGGILMGGGNGGGIVYVQAQSLTSSGFTISSNGLKGGNSIGDGASGGGAGGTIMMNVVAYNDAAKLEAKGGDGGQVDNELINYKCYGEGGGGSGGVVYTKNAPVSGTINVNGGARGARINSQSNCGSEVPGGPGIVGVSSTGFAPVQSTSLSTSCTFVLPTTLLYFKAGVTNNDVTARWQVVQPGDVRTFVVERRKGSEGWKSIATVSAREGVDTYSVQDQNLPGGDYTYRLKIMERDGAVNYSSLQRVVIAAYRQLTLYPNPTKGVLHILLPLGSDKELKVYDLSGRLLLQKRIADPGSLIAEDVSSLKEGLYILRIGMLRKVFTIQ